MKISFFNLKDNPQVREDIYLIDGNGTVKNANLSNASIKATQGSKIVLKNCRLDGSKIDRGIKIINGGNR